MLCEAKQWTLQSVDLILPSQVFLKSLHWAFSVFQKLLSSSLIFITNLRSRASSSETPTDTEVAKSKRPREGPVRCLGGRRKAVDLGLGKITGFSKWRKRKSNCKENWMVSGRKASVQRTVGTICRGGLDGGRQGKQSQLGIINRQAHSKWARWPRGRLRTLASLGTCS